jgi:hypothetical protein
MLFIRRRIWDPWNIAHIVRHDVLHDELEEVGHATPVTSQTYKAASGW